MWYFSKESEIRRDDICLDYPGGLRDVNQPDKIITFPCHGEKGNQEWIYTKVNNLKNKKLKNKYILFLIQRKNKLHTNCQIYASS